MNTLMTQQNSATTVAVRLDSVSRVYGPTVALDHMSLELRAGAVHAFVGQNGAGKSTCLGLIAGRVRPSEGTVTVMGTQLPSNATPIVARANGVAAIYQELTIIPALSAWENAYLGQLEHRGGLINKQKMRDEFIAACKRLSITIDPDARAGSLSLADQQMIEIIRALTVNSRILLLDEPTAALSPPERKALFDTMRSLRAEGVCMVLVSHYLDEVLENSDEVYVFRDGRLVTQKPAQQWQESTLVEAMLGEELKALDAVAEAADAAQVETPQPTVRGARTDTPLLRLEGVQVGRLQDVDLQVWPGEIVGIGGLVGSGRSTLMRALAGLQPAQGRMWLDGKEQTMPKTPRDAWRDRISLIPEDRKVQGLALGLSGRDNIVLSDLSAVSRFGWISGRRVKARTNELATEYGLPLSMVTKTARHLSGGNQQKLLFARWGHRRPRLLLADEATRGIDIGAKGQVLEMLRRLADEGMAIIFVSSELEEVAAVSDRIYVMSSGRVAGELDHPNHHTQNDIVELAFAGQNRKS